VSFHLKIVHYSVFVCTWITPIMEYFK